MAAAGREDEENYLLLAMAFLKWLLRSVILGEATVNRFSGDDGRGGVWNGSATTSFGSTVFRSYCRGYSEIGWGVPWWGQHTISLIAFKIIVDDSLLGSSS